MHVFVPCQTLLISSTSNLCDFSLPQYQVRIFNLFYSRINYYTNFSFIFDRFDIEKNFPSNSSQASKDSQINNHLSVMFCLY